MTAAPAHIESPCRLHRARRKPARAGPRNARRHVRRENTCRAPIARSSTMPDAFMSDEEHRGAGIVRAGHDDRERRAVGAGDEPLAAVDDVVHRRRAWRWSFEHRRDRSRRPAPVRSCRSTIGSRPLASGRSQRSFCAGVATASSRCMLPSSGANTLSAMRTERRVAGFLERDGAAKVAEREAAVFARDMRRQQAGRARLLDQLPAQVLGRARAACGAASASSGITSSAMNARIARLQRRAGPGKARSRPP